MGRASTVETMIVAVSLGWLAESSDADLAVVVAEIVVSVIG
jgi:hypothetical protein